MKYFAIILCAFGLLFGCVKKSKPQQADGSVEEWFSAKDKIHVLSTTAMIGNLVESIGKDKIAHLTLIIGDVDPHSYELVKGDDEKIDQANIVFSNGLGLEHGASLQYKLTHHSFAVALGDRLFEKNREIFITVDGQLDPHIWMDVSLWSEAIPYIVNALSEKAPMHAAFFEENGRQLKESLRALDEKMQKEFQKIPAKRRYLVTSHDAFNYFARRYLAQPGESEEIWKMRFQAPEGLAPDGQLSLADIGRVIDHLCQYQIPVVFPESNVSKDALKKIVSVCAKRGHRVSLSSFALYGDTMGPKGSGAESYLKMMEHNGQVISTLLGEQHE